MLLFSTILDIDSQFTRDKFYQLVIEWNQKSPHGDTRISDIKWNGESKIRFGDEFKRLSFDEFKNRNIARFEKVDQTGAEWTTDFVMNFDEMKMAIQLSRIFQPNALKDDGVFSAPYLIKMLFEKKLLKNDLDLQTTYSPIYVNEKNYRLLGKLTSGNTHYQLPVVYVSKNTNNQDPVDVRKLARKLGGAAHVLVQENHELNNRIRECCNGKNAYNGAVGIYFPGKITKRFMYWTFPDFDNNLQRKVIQDVIHYGTVQRIPLLYTWNGVKSKIELAEIEKKETEARKLAKYAKNESEQIVRTFDEENAELKEQNKKLIRENQQLKEEIRDLQERSGSYNSSPLIFFGNEEELFPGEIKDMVLSVLNDMINKLQPEKRTRRADIIRDIVQSNDYEGILEKKAKDLKNELKGYRTMEKPTRKFLQDFGFVITEDGKHYKLKYYKDNRYTSILPKTSSDRRAGLNAASEMKNKFL